MEKRVIIVNLNNPTEADKSLVALLEQMISMWTVKNPIANEQVKAATVTVLPVNNAWAKMRQGEADCVIFISKTQDRAARNFKKACSYIKVIIILDGPLSEYKPGDGIVLFEKGPDAVSGLKEEILTS